VLTGAAKQIDTKIANGRLAFGILQLCRTLAALHSLLGPGWYRLKRYRTAR
jgi:hypothetical protein